jgi:hypothetical protein
MGRLAVEAHKRADEVVLYSRPRRDITARFPRIAEAVAALPRRTVVLDGELVAFDASHRPVSTCCRRHSAANNCSAWPSTISTFHVDRSSRLRLLYQRQRLGRIPHRSVSADQHDVLGHIQAVNNDSADP